MTLANGARENERTIGIITVTVGHYVAHQAVAAVTNGTPLLGLPVLRQIGRFTIDAAYEQLILNESTQCKTPSEATLKEADEAQAQVTEIMKAPMDSSKAQAPSEEQKPENARPAPPIPDVAAGGRITGRRDPAPAERRRRGAAPAARPARHRSGGRCQQSRTFRNTNSRARFNSRRSPAATPNSRYLTVSLWTDQVAFAREP